MCGRASMQWRPPVWCVLSVMISPWVSLARCASVWTSVIWPGATSLWITLGMTSVSVTAGMWSWPVKPVFVPVIMARCGPSMVSHARMMSPSLKVCLFLHGEWPLYEFYLSWHRFGKSLLYCSIPSWVGNTSENCSKLILASIEMFTYCTKMMQAI